MESQSNDILTSIDWKWKSLYFADTEYAVVIQSCHCYKSCKETIITGQAFWGGKSLLPKFSFPPEEIY